ncbi:uncharacterized protein ppp1r3aa [Colossoma macropomum]|uniref:uncharacterized protein ppp1r3aa n=1 Tax=Colossoma macropomum TaxID=42526 RepID=UPI001863B37E|nr:uncharacterized protein ppp1r3aa [Colossoma macropomum]
MSAEEPGLLVASYCTETPTLSAWVQDKGEEEEEKDEEHFEESNRREEPQRSSSDESEESEPEPPPPSAIRRKVSFADAFGLELVSVKEFDSRAETGPDGLGRMQAREENYYLSSLFVVPSSNEELSLLLQQNKLELESIELLPGSTTIRGIIRVLNLSYHKAVYVRTTLDRWQTHFDLLAEYIPGSSDGQTDRFSFRFTLVPPFKAEGARVEFCLRYESSAGTFWANNGGTNYVLFCHQKEAKELKEKEGEKERDTEENNYKEKKSCLKGRRKWSNAELKSTGSSSDLSEPESSKSEESEEEKTQNEAEMEACRKTLVERRNRRRAARLARVQDYFSQRQTEVQKAERDLKMAIPASHLSTPVGLDTSGVSLVHNRKDQDTPPILTYHQIPLLSLDWGKHTTPPTHPNTPMIHSGASPDIPEKQLAEEESTGSSTDAWEAFLKGTDSSGTHANALDQECLLCVASLPSHNECNMSTPGEKVLSENLQSPLTIGNRSLRYFSPEETLESDPAEKWQDFKPCHAKEEALDNKYIERPGITPETHIVQESELVWVQPGTETQDRLTYREKSFSEDASFQESNPLEMVQTMDATESQDSKGEHRVSPEECVGNPNYSGPEADVKGDSDKMVDDTLTFREIKDKPFTDRQTGRGGPLERLCTDEDRELKRVKEHIRKENEIAVEIRVKVSCNEYPGDLTEGLESRRQGENEEPSQLRDQSMEMISASRSLVFDEEEFNTGTEWSDRKASKSQEEEEIAGHKPEKEGLAEKSETMSSVAVDKDIADREYEISSIAKMGGQEEPYEVDKVIHGRKGGGDACKDFITCKEPHKTHGTTDTCTSAPTLPVTSHSSDSSGLFGWTESVSEAGPLLFSGPFGETLRHRPAQDLQYLQDPEAEYPAPLSKTATPSVSTMSSSLLAWWAEFCSPRHISKALLYTILFLIFITAYLHDLPVCLGIYLLSVCWWCGQSMKKRVTTADSVD